MPIPLALIIGVAATAAGTLANQRAAAKADAQQAQYIQQQRAALSDQRAATERRQATLQDQLAQDQALQAQQRQSLADTLSQANPQALQDDLTAQTQQATEAFTQGADQDSLNRDMGAVSFTTPAGNTLSVTDRADRAGALSQDLAQRLGALGALSAYGTAGADQALALSRGAQDQELLGGLRTGLGRAYDISGRTLQSGEQALGAGAQALGNQYAPVDTRLGDVLTSVGNAAMMYGAFNAGAGAAGAAGQPTMAGTLAGTAYGTAPMSQQSRMLATQGAGLVPWM